MLKESDAGRSVRMCVFCAECVFNEVYLIFSFSIKINKFLIRMFVLFVCQCVGVRVCVCVCVSVCVCASFKFVHFAVICYFQF